MQKNVRFLPWPNPHKKENPYQKLLYKGLQSHGITVAPTPLLFSFLPYVKKFEWLHLNWPGKLYNSNNPIKQERRFEKFINTLTKLKKSGTRIIWTMHNRLPHECSDDNFQKMAYAKIIELCDIIHVHFPAAKEEIVREYHTDPAKIFIMYHGLFTNYFGERIPKQDARKILHIPMDCKVALNFGYLKRYKGIEAAVKAFHESKDDNLYFVIAGKPVDKDVVEFLKKASEKNSKIILKLSLIKDKEVAPLFSAADVFIYPGQNFFTTGSVHLAFAYDLPVIGIPKNNLLLFEGKSYFIPWAPDNQDTLISILNNLDDWLQTVNYRELNDLKRTLHWNNLTVDLSQKLKEI